MPAGYAYIRSQMNQLELSQARGRGRWVHPLFFSYLTKKWPKSIIFIIIVFLKVNIKKEK